MPGSLEKYRAKRSAQRTPEPFGSKGAARPRLFVVQEHGARRLHHDFRLELGGVLLSWAVPKGPSLDPQQKRLAVEVEDHPVEYADFEGVIPEGNYGAGPVIVWDRGSWRALEDPEAGIRKGKLLFELFGYKLRGVWTLVRTKRPRDRGPGHGPSKEWLLIKKADGWARKPGTDALPAESVLSGLTLDEMAAGSHRAAKIAGELERLGAKHRRVRVRDVSIMLAETAKPFSAPGWLFEIKYDGYRLLAARQEGKPLLLYRRGNEATRTFPEIARAIGALPFDAVFDGEVVVLDEAGRPSFQRLQNRVHLTRPVDLEAAAIELPATLFVFDLLAFESFDLRALPLEVRKRILARLLPPAGPLRYADHVVAKGEQLYAAAVARGLEGLVAKRVDSRYAAGRSSSWLKLPAHKSEDFVVVGFTSPRGSRPGVGALDLASATPEGYVYAGRVGTGLSIAQLVATRAELEPLVRKSPPCTGNLPPSRDHFWVEPRRVCTVRFLGTTDDGLLRQASFVGFRDDKRPEECVRQGEAEPGGEPGAGSGDGPDGAAATGARTGAEAGKMDADQVKLTHTDKIFWPDEGYTKGDLIAYYRQVSPWLLPYLRDRPLVLTRFPDGITGKSFFQKDAPGFTPDWIRTERMWSDQAGREIDYFVCDDEATLVYLINLGTIPLHIWSSRVAELARPDWCILDLDPKTAPFSHVVRVARAIHALLDEIGLPGFIKTSGQAGLHILVPLGGQCTYEHSKSLGELIARIIADDLSDIATVARSLADRSGRVYVDFLQNGHGKTIASPFSARPIAGGRVSMPLTWSEVGPRLDPARFTLKTAMRRLARWSADPMAGVLSERPDLTEALGILGQRMGKTKRKK